MLKGGYQKKKESKSNVTDQVEKLPIENCIKKIIIMKIIIIIVMIIYFLKISFHSFNSLIGKAFPGFRIS